MSEIYRCMDCLKEFSFDYSDVTLEGYDHENKNAPQNHDIIQNYLKLLGFKLKINTCQDCLSSIKISSNILLDQRKKESDYLNQNYETQTKKFSELKNETSSLEDYTEEKEKELSEKLEKIKKDIAQNEEKYKNLIKELREIEKKEEKFIEEEKNFGKDFIKINKNVALNKDINLDYQNKIKSFYSKYILTDLFEISIHEEYGKINGCLFNDPLNFSHFDNINAGWGYIALLTKLISVKYQVEINNYDIKPLGNFSIVTNGEISFELYISNKPNGKLMFNNAMVKYLKYLNELIKYLTEKKIFDIKLMDTCPKIKDDKIDGLSIQIENEKNDNWIQCMKNLLIILKFLLSQSLTEENKVYKANINIAELINLNNPKI